MIGFRAAEISELPLIWQALKNKAIFPDFSALVDYQRSNPWSVQVSAGDLSCLGVVGKWRSHLRIGSIKAFVAPDQQGKKLLHHLISVLKKEGFQIILSPPFRQSELSLFYQAGFESYHRIVVFRKTTLSQLPDISTSVDVRKFEPAYFSGLMKIEKEAFSDFWRWGKEELNDAVGAGNCHVAFFKDEAIGYNVTTIKQWDGTIARLAVLPKLQRKGFGSELLACSLGWLQTEKARSVLITTQAANRIAQHLYAKFGFKLWDEDRIILRLEF